MSIVGRKGKLSPGHTHGSVQEIIWDRLEDVLTADVLLGVKFISQAPF